MIENKLPGKKIYLTKRQRNTLITYLEEDIEELDSIIGDLSSNKFPSETDEEELRDAIREKVDIQDILTKIWEED